MFQVSLTPYSYPALRYGESAFAAVVPVRKINLDPGPPTKSLRRSSGSDTIQPRFPVSGNRGITSPNHCSMCIIQIP